MVYVTGDTHGDFSRFKSRAARRLRRGDTLIVLGDFGFIWDGSKKEKRILKKLSKKKYNILFLDGPHENYDMLRNIPISEWNGGRVQVIEGNLMHLLRGEIYNIENESYFVFGGGECADRDMRDEADTWWEEEMPSAEQMQYGRMRLKEHGNKVDYILTHEYPGRGAGFFGTSGRQNGLNAYLGLIASEIEYKRWYVGSLHIDRSLSKRLHAVFQQICPVNAVADK